MDAEIGPAYDANIKKAKKRVSNFLAVLLQKPDAPLVKIVGGQGRVNFYKLAVKGEQSDAGTSD
jgi:hypothetical protein